MPTHFNLQDKTYNKMYTVNGRGGSTDLQIAGTFETEHAFSLDVGYVYQRADFYVRFLMI